jgi:large subunit ribosomal protein L5
MAARLKEKYHKEIKQALQKELDLDNPMAVPRLEKIVINMGLGEATGNTKLLDPLVADLANITGQKPVTTKAKKSIAAFKVREGMSIGAMVTLRNDKAYEFLDRLIATALPRVRDFRGVSTKSGKAEGHEYHDCDHGQGRQRREGAAEALRDAVPARGVRNEFLVPSS